MSKRILFVGTIEECNEEIEASLEVLRACQAAGDLIAEEQIMDELYGEYEMFTEQELKELEELEEAEQAYWEEVRQAELDLYRKEVK